MLYNQIKVIHILNDYDRLKATGLYLLVHSNLDITNLNIVNFAI